MSLQIELTNPSTKPLIVGLLGIAQERLYRRHTKHDLELIRTTDAPEDIEAPASHAPWANVKEQKIFHGKTLTLNTDHLFYIVPDDVQFDGGKSELIASFHLTNVRRNGSGADYWSDPVTIALPSNCDAD